MVLLLHQFPVESSEHDSALLSVPPSRRKRESVEWLSTCMRSSSRRLIEVQMRIHQGAWLNLMSHCVDSMQSCTQERNGISRPRLPLSWLTSIFNLRQSPCSVCLKFTKEWRHCRLFFLAMLKQLKRNLTWLKLIFQTFLSSLPLLIARATWSHEQRIPTRNIWIN